MQTTVMHEIALEENAFFACTVLKYGARYYIVQILLHTFIHTVY